MRRIIIVLLTLFVCGLFYGDLVASDDKLVTLHGKAGLSLGNLTDSTLFQIFIYIEEDGGQKTILAYVPVGYSVKGSSDELRRFILLAGHKTGFPVTVTMKGYLLSRNNLSISECTPHQFQCYNEEQGINCYVLQELVIGDNVMKFN